MNGTKYTVSSMEDVRRAIRAGFKGFEVVSKDEQTRLNFPKFLTVLSPFVPSFPFKKCMTLNITHH